MGRRITIVVSNNLLTDQRVHKTAISLQKKEYIVKVIGRNYPKNKLINRPYNYYLLNILFNKEVQFYFFYQIQLFLYLLFRKKTDLWSNDLDTLLPCYVISKLKRTRLFYDSHEYFSELPELKNSPFKRKIWRALEDCLYPRLKNLVTVNKSLADLIQNRYKTPCFYIQNVPFKFEFPKPNKKWNRTLLYQGAINIDRGLEELIEAMPYVKDAQFVLIGEGDVSNKLKKRVEELDLKERVSFMGKLDFSKLKLITPKATIGIAIGKNVGLSYQLSLSNKLFDYIHAEVPVLVGHLKEIKHIVETYEFGQVLDSYEPENMANQINAMLANQELLDKYSNNQKQLKHLWDWETQFDKVYDLINR